jgi:integrase
LVVYPSQRKVFILRFRRPSDGKSAKLTLGPYMEGGEYTEAPAIGAPLTLAAARQLAATAQLAKAHGRDPAAEKAARKAASASAQLTFGKAVEAYLGRCQERQRSWQETRSTLAGLATLWAERPLADITAQELYEQLESSVSDGILGRKQRSPGRSSEARRRQLFSVLSGLFRFCLATRRLTHNPMSGLERPSPAPSRDRIFDDEEFRIFWAATAALGPRHAACLKVLALTGLRLREASEMKWSELRDGLLVLPPSRTKNKREHRLPLSQTVEEIIAGLPRVASGSHGMRHDGWVFSISGRTHIEGWTQVKAALDKAMRARGWDGQPWRIHDLRRWHCSTQARLGTALHVTEKLVNHASGQLSGVAGIYVRYSFQGDMLEAAEKLAGFVRQLTAAETVRDLAA